MSKALLKSTGIVSAMTSLSRVTGFIRDMVYAQMFGAGSGTDAFFVAFRIPNFLRRLFAEGAFSQAFVPVFSEYQTQRPREELKELVLMFLPHPVDYYCKAFSIGIATTVFLLAFEDIMLSCSNISNREYKSIEHLFLFFSLALTIGN